MTTRGALKARISDDLARDNLSSQIADAIEDSISYYRTTRFGFNETRDLTFATANGQAIYTGDDNSDIPLFFDIDEVFLIEGDDNYRLRKDDPQRLEFLSDGSASTGRPYRYAWFDNSFRLYPIPDAAYTVRPVGAVEKASPNSDTQTGNVWMTKAFELIRCRAKSYLYAHVIKNLEMAGVMQEAEQQALRQLRKANNRLVTSGLIRPTQF